MFKKILLAAVMLSPVLVPPSPAAAEVVFGPQIEVGGKFGNDRNIGFTKLMLPWYQQDDLLLFSDIRGRLDDNETQEYNAGLGLRFLLDEESGIGIYGFVDRLKSTYQHSYTQGTFGAEYFKPDWDLRVNAYLPEDKENMINSLSTLSISGSSISVRRGLEKPLPGFDLEVGFRLPLDKFDARAYIGGFYFEDGGFEEVDESFESLATCS